MLTVKVVDKQKGKTVKGARVSLYISGFLTGGVTQA